MDGQKTVIAFKGFDKDLKCSGFQYEIGKGYELPAYGKQPLVCNYGFHACENPLDVLLFYFINYFFILYVIEYKHIISL